MSENLNQAILGIWMADPEDLDSIQAFSEIVLYFYPDGCVLCVRRSYDNDRIV